MTLTLRNAEIDVIIDPGRGCDILSISHRSSDLNVLLETPWRHRADQIRAGESVPTSGDSWAAWTEQYRGGWQTLLPNAGSSRSVNGAPWGYHGEASTVPWRVDSANPTDATLSVELFTVPLVVHRVIRLVGSTLIIADTITNTSSVSTSFDYVSHPAFGGAFLDGNCSISSAASTFTFDRQNPGSLGVAGSSHPWPLATSRKLTPIDLRSLPSISEPRSIYGWMSNFDIRSVTLTNHDLGLEVGLSWSAGLPYAWLWQEFNQTKEFPWFGMGRALAIEPASTPTDGARATVITVDAGASTSLEVEMRLQPTITL